MSMTIHVPMTVEETTTVESYENCTRYRWTITRLRKPDGDIHIHTQCEEVPDVGPLTMILPGPDVDEIAIRDMLQAAKGRKRKPREKPDITRLYDEFRERRGREHDTKTTHSLMNLEIKK